MRLAFSIDCVATVAFATFVSATGAAAQQYSRRPADPSVPTFAKDVAPILYKNCTGCHRPGEIAPMSLLSYEDARPWAKAIRDEVTERHMPPWHADAPLGTFLNERGLTDQEREILLRWANNGAPKGDVNDLPPAPTYPDGWSAGKPDAVFEMAEDYKVPAEGVIQYEYFYIPTNFTEPKWVKSIEIRPGNRSVVHHVLAFYRAVPDMQRTPVFRPNQAHVRAPAERVPGQRPPREDLKLPQRILATYAPGTAPQVAPPGTAFRLEPGGIIELQMHYTASGEDATDRTRVGLVFSNEPSPREIRAGQFFNATLEIPAGASNVPIETDAEFLQDAILWGILPHTHVRGKRWAYKLVLPDGTAKSILSVPNYDFNWQTYYMFREPLQIPKGARIVSTAWYDNSPANKANPDPKMDVKWGDQTWEEMQYTGVLFSPVQPPKPLEKKP